MIVHYSLTRPKRATTAPRIARNASPEERFVGARLRSLDGPRLLLGRPMRVAVGTRIAPRPPHRSRLLAASWPESVGEPEEVLLVDGLENRRDRLLDDFVL